MTKDDIGFDEWFDLVALNVLDRTGVQMQDPDCVRDDYEEGKDIYDVIDEMVAEYGEVE